MVLISKGNTDTWGIEILEVFWKVLEAVIDTRIKIALQFHGVLHGFHAERGTGAIIMDLKLNQDLAIVYQDLLFLVLLDIRKAYANLYCEQLL